MSTTQIAAKDLAAGQLVWVEGRGWKTVSRSGDRGSSMVSVCLGTNECLSYPDLIVRPEFVFTVKEQ